MVKFATAGLLIQALVQKLTEAVNVTTLYYGFFFDYITASSIKFATDQYLTSLLEHPEFSIFLQNITVNAGVSDIYQYYEKPTDPNTGKYDPFYHVTARYCGTDQALCLEYEETNSKYINTTFEMHLVGFVFTNRTFGIRVNLTSEQLPLFDQESKTRMKNVDIMVGYDRVPILPGITLEDIPLPLVRPSSETKAHITVGCAPGIPAVTTGPDMLLSIGYENGNPNVTEHIFTEIKDPLVPARNMTVIEYKLNSEKLEDYIFIVYPSMKMLANATLSPYFQPVPPSTEAPPNAALYD